MSRPDGTERPDQPTTMPEGLGRWPSLRDVPCAEDERHGLHEATAWTRVLLTTYVARLASVDFVSCGHLSGSGVGTFWHKVPGLLLCGSCNVSLLLATDAGPTQCARCARLVEPGKGELVNEVEVLRAYPGVMVRWTSCRACHEVEWAARTHE